jgi:hypothetical protein
MIFLFLFFKNTTFKSEKIELFNKKASTFDADFFINLHF